MSVRAAPYLRYAGGASAAVVDMEEVAAPRHVQRTIVAASTVRHAGTSVLTEIIGIAVTGQIMGTSASVLNSSAHASGTGNNVNTTTPR